MKIKIVFVIGIKIDIWIELNVDIEIKNAEEYQLLIEMKEYYHSFSSSHLVDTILNSVSTDHLS